MHQIPNEAVTHNGRFHADDVFSAALLEILNPNIHISRVPSIPENFTGIVFDLSNGTFDHHNSNMKYRDNGVPYASFGLLWKEYGHTLVSESAARTFDESFIQPLDSQDNYGGNNMLCRAITQANPKWNSSDNPDECFFKAVEFAKFVLINEIESMKSTECAVKIVKDALSKQNKGIVTLSIGVPWKSVLIPEPVYFVIYPSTRGGFNAQAVPRSIESNECKIYFPETWRGQTDSLAEISGIPDLTFCHSSGYLISANSIGAAAKACEIAIKNAP